MFVRSYCWADSISPTDGQSARTVGQCAFTGHELLTRYALGIPQRPAPTGSPAPEFRDEQFAVQMTSAAMVIGNHDCNGKSGLSGLARSLHACAFPFLRLLGGFDRLIAESSRELVTSGK